MNLVTYIEKNTHKLSNKIALIDDAQEEIAYSDLWKNVNKYSQFLSSLKIKEGDRVALILPNSPQYIFIFLSLLKINAVVSPIRYGATLFEIKNYIKFLKPSYLISNKNFLKKFLNISSFSTDFPILISKKSIKKMSFLERVISFERIKEFTDSSPKVNNISEIATITFTYRGLGYPLGVMMSHKSYVEDIKLVVQEANMEEKDIVLLSSPLNYAYSLVTSFLCPLSVGATIVLSENLEFSKVIEKILKYKISSIANVPTFFLFLIKSCGNNLEDLVSLKKIISGGSKLDKDLYLEYLRFGFKIYEGYGLTECLPLMSNNLQANRKQSVGVPPKNFIEIKILRKNSLKTKSPYCVGEIIIRTKTLMTGYLNNSEMTKRVIKDGWFLTGDMGYFDKDGFLYFVKTKKNIIKIGGNMVDLQEVRKVILDFKDVLDVSFIIKDDELWGNLLDARVYVKNSDNVTSINLKRFLRSRLSSFKVPRNITVI